MRKIVLIFIFFGLALRTYYLADVAFHDWDEGMYAEIASEIVEDKSLILKFNNQLWFDKPFLSYSLLAATFILFGLPEFWGRALMATIAMGIVILLYLLGKKLYLHFFAITINKLESWERELIFLLPVIVLISNVSFLDRATLLNTDTLLVFSWLGYFTFRSNFFLKLFFLCIGVWSKSLVGFFPAVLEIFILKRDDINLQNFFKFIVLLIFPLSWHIINFFLYGDLFVKAHFLDQLVRRLYIPLELHYAGKLFYPKLILENMGPISPIILIGYLHGLCLIMSLKKNALNFAGMFESIKNIYVEKEKIWFLMIFCSGVLLTVFLTLSITKLEWYYVWFAPFLSLPVGVTYIYFVKNRFLKIAMLFLIILWSAYKFIPQTYAFKIMELKYTMPVTTQVAKCISTLENGTLGALVDEKERRARKVIEAANVASSSTFYWGISVSFAFYSGRDVDYYYDISSFTSNIGKYPYIILHKEDSINSKLSEKINNLSAIKKCWIGDWQVYRSKQ